MTSRLPSANKAGLARQRSGIVRRTSGGGQLSLPVYVQLVVHFRQLIASGQWKVGDQIPVLEDLSKQHGAARATIRHAIGFLETEGLIGRYRGRGTFVLSTPKNDVWYDIPVAWADVGKNALTTQVEWLECRSTDALSSRVNVSGKLAEKYQLLRRVLYHNKVAYCVATSFIERSLYKTISKAGFSAPGDDGSDPDPLKLIGAALGNRLGKVEQIVTAQIADSATSEILDFHAGSAIMVVNRSALDDAGTVVYASEGSFRSDFVRVRVRMR